MYKGITKQEFYRTLNFMLLHGIINYQEYANLERKALPFIR